VQVISGDTLRQSARIYDGDPDGDIGDSVVGVGRLDGAETDTMALVHSAGRDMALGGDQLWLVSGPLCGTYVLQEIGTPVEAPATAYIPEVAGADRVFVGIDDGESGGYVFAER
jgi:hypothetical protein